MGADSNEFKGQEIFDVPQTLGFLKFLKNDEFGREIVLWINDKFADLPIANVDLSMYKEGEHIAASSLFYTACVNAALEELRIKDYRIPTPEDALAISRARGMPDFASHYFGVVIVTKEGEHAKNISSLLAPYKVREEELPVAVFGLTAKRDPRLPYGIRLDSAERPTLSPALASGATLRASNRQTLEKILKGESAEFGRFGVALHDEEILVIPNTNGMQGIHQLGNRFIYSRNSASVSPYSAQVALIKEK